MILALAEFCFGLDDAHGLSFAIGGRAKFLHQCLVQRAAHSQHVVDGERVYAARDAVRIGAIIGKNLQAAIHRRHGLYRQPAPGSLGQIQMFGSARGRLLQIEIFAGRAVEQ